MTNVNNNFGLYTKYSSKPRFFSRPTFKFYQIYEQMFGKSFENFKIQNQMNALFKRSTTTWCLKNSKNIRGENKIKNWLTPTPQKLV